jgi:hypothetical protein
MLVGRIGSGGGESQGHCSGFPGIAGAVNTRPADAVI